MRHVRRMAVFPGEGFVENPTRKRNEKADGSSLTHPPSHTIHLVQAKLFFGNPALRPARRAGWLS